MGRGVHAPGEAGDDRGAGLRELRPEGPCRFEPRARGAARPDHGDGRRVGIWCAAREENGRRVVDLTQEGGVAGIRQKKDARSGLREAPRVFLDLSSAIGREERRDCRDLLAGDPGGLFRGQRAHGRRRSGRKKKRPERAARSSAPLPGPDESCPGIVRRAVHAAPLLL